MPVVFAACKEVVGRCRLFKMVQDNMDEFMTDDRGKKYKAHFVNYVEGIYVGYRFWETASKEGFIDYDNFVQYPFGYGLSYTKFDRKMEELAESNGEITVTVTVTNTGNVAGKDVVEIYYNPPYTNGGIEKASANLIAFAKTKELAPSESETVKLKFNAYDMASYDYIKTKAYVLEKGKYEISLQTDSHNIVDTKIYNVDEDTFYTDNNKRISDKVAATNLLDDMRGDVVYLGFNCLNPDCKEFIFLKEDSITEDFSVVCPKCGYIHEAAGETKFYDS